LGGKGYHFKIHAAKSPNTTHCRSISLFTNRHWKLATIIRAFDAKSHSKDTLNYTSVTESLRKKYTSMFT